MSGVIIAVAVADRLKKKLILVRKQGEKTHGKDLESSVGIGRKFRYIIIDDQIDTGATIDRILEKIEVPDPLEIASLTFPGGTPATVEVDPSNKQRFRVKNTNA